MKKKLLLTAGFLAAFSMATTMAATLCAANSTVSTISTDPTGGAGSWQMSVIKPDGTTLKLKSDPQKSIDIDTDQGWEVYTLALNAKTIGGLVDVYNTQGTDCTVFDEIDMR